jgi:hypothetical protein
MVTFKNKKEVLEMSIEGRRIETFLHFTFEIFKNLLDQMLG